MLNIVIPMAGRGSRFAEKGFIEPKPLIKVFDRTMIELVVDNLRPIQPHRFIFVCQSEHLDKFNLREILHRVSPGSLIIPIRAVTEGAACTVLLAKEFINNHDSLMIANCDQYVDVDINYYLNEMKLRNLDGLIMTMYADDPKWSYIKYDKDYLITEVVEKKVVSDEATVGIYNYRHGASFVRAAEGMIQKNLRVNNEFYVAPAYEEMINLGSRVGFFNVDKYGNGMYGLGIPEDLARFLARGKTIRHG